MSTAQEQTKSDATPLPDAMQKSIKELDAIITQLIDQKRELIRENIRLRNTITALEARLDEPRSL